jgi:hypothetical protein
VWPQLAQSPPGPSRPVHSQISELQLSEASARASAKAEATAAAASGKQLTQQQRQQAAEAGRAVADAVRLRETIRWGTRRTQPASPFGPGRVSCFPLCAALHDPPCPRHNPHRQLEEEALARTRLLDASASQLAAADAGAEAARVAAEGAQRELEQLREASRRQVALLGEEATGLRRQVGRRGWGQLGPGDACNHECWWCPLQRTAEWSPHDASHSFEFKRCQVAELEQQLASATADLRRVRAAAGLSASAAAGQAAGSRGRVSEDGSDQQGSAPEEGASPRCADADAAAAAGDGDLAAALGRAARAEAALAEAEALIVQVGGHGGRERSRAPALSMLECSWATAAQRRQGAAARDSPRT